MPFSTYLPEHMGSIRLAPLGPFVAGSYAELTLTYTAGTFGIDDTGMVKISWRTTSDMAKPQFDDPAAPNYTTVEASNAAQLEVRFDRLNIRPWANTLLIRVGRGYLRAGDTLTVRFGDRRQGSAGFRLQTNCEERVELKTSVDAFATYEFTELREQPGFALVAGPATHWKAIWPSLAMVGEPFRAGLALPLRSHERLAQVQESGGAGGEARGGRGLGQIRSGTQSALRSPAFQRMIPKAERRASSAGTFFSSATFIASRTMPLKSST